MKRFWFFFFFGRGRGVHKNMNCVFPLKTSNKYDVLFVVKRFFLEFTGTIESYYFREIEMCHFRDWNMSICQYHNINNVNMSFVMLKYFNFWEIEICRAREIEMFHFREIKLCHSRRLKYVIFEILQNFHFREVENCRPREIEMFNFWEIELCHSRRLIYVIFEI